jgi:hypothetical protein
MRLDMSTAFAATYRASGFGSIAQLSLPGFVRNLAHTARS